MARSLGATAARPQQRQRQQRPLPQQGPAWTTSSSATTSSSTSRAPMLASEDANSSNTPLSGQRRSGAHPPCVSGPLSESKFTKYEKSGEPLPEQFGAPDISNMNLESPGSLQQCLSKSIAPGDYRHTAVEDAAFDSRNKRPKKWSTPAPCKSGRPMVVREFVPAIGDSKSLTVPQTMSCPIGRHSPLSESIGLTVPHTMLCPNGHHSLLPESVGLTVSRNAPAVAGHQGPLLESFEQNSSPAVEQSEFENENAGARISAQASRVPELSCPNISLEQMLTNKSDHNPSGSGWPTAFSLDHVSPASRPQPVSSSTGAGACGLPEQRFGHCRPQIDLQMEEQFGHTCSGHHGPLGNSKCYRSTSGPLSSMSPTSSLQAARCRLAPRGLNSTAPVLHSAIMVTNGLLLTTSLRPRGTTNTTTSDSRPPEQDASRSGLVARSYRAGYTHGKVSNCDAGCPAVSIDDAGCPAVNRYDSGFQHSAHQNACRQAVWFEPPNAPWHGFKSARVVQHHEPSPPPCGASCGSSPIRYRALSATGMPQAVAWITLSFSGERSHRHCLWRLRRFRCLQLSSSKRRCASRARPYWPRLCAVHLTKAMATPFSRRRVV